MWQYKKFRKQEFIPLIKFLVEMYQPDTYVEVGVQKGHCFNQIAPLVKQAVGVDIDIRASVTTSDNISLFEMPALEFAGAWPKDRQIDLLFMDADHSKQGVLKSFDALSKFVTPQTGLILIHDTYPGSEHLVNCDYCHTAWEAARAIHSLKKYSKFEIVTLPGPYAGISIIRNAGRHLHWT
jgi:predicted O-methyltransferase YrrM